MGYIKKFGSCCAFPFFVLCALRSQNSALNKRFAKKENFLHISDKPFGVIMDRRNFIKSSTAAGLGLTFRCGRARSSADAKFLQEKTSDKMLFPRPGDGVQVAITPVGLAWLPCEQANAYRIIIKDQSGTNVYTKTIDPDPVHLPDQVFPSGRYQWDVLALDESGKEIARRGMQSYTIRPEAVDLPWIDPRVLLKSVPVERPRILYPKYKLDEIRSTLGSSRKKSWQACKQAAEKALNIGIPEYPAYHLIKDRSARRMEYVRYFQYFRKYINGALMDLALGFLMTEDSRYSDAAKKIFLEIATWPTDDDDVTSVNAKWGDEAGLSFSKCAHIAYDWLYPSFSDSEKQKIFTMCKERAWQTWRRMQRKNYLTYPGESHDGRMIAYLSDQALALAHETDDTLTWLNYSLKALTTIYPHWGGLDGGWAEGTAYGLWYNTFYMPAFQGLEQLCGYNLWQRPFFKNVRHFFFYCTANHGEIRPFGDGAESGGPGVNKGSGYGELMAFHAHRYNDPAIGWWVKQIPGWDGGRADFTSLIYPDELPSKPPQDIPHSRAFTSVGWAGLHSDISTPEHDTVLIFKSSPYGSVSHSHGDQNAFAIMKGGTALAIPSGYYGPSYGKPHHAEWTRSTKANNCILVNGQGQVLRSAQAKGKITAFKEAKGFSLVVGDATQAYQGTLDLCKRIVLFLRPGLFLVLDDLAAPRPSIFQWLLHSFEEMDIDGQHIISRRHGKTLNVHLASTQPMSVSQTDQFEPSFNTGIPEKFHEEKANQWHMTAESMQKVETLRIAAVMSVTGPEEIMDLELQQQTGWVGVHASGNFGTIEGWMQIEPYTGGPETFGDDVMSGKAIMCGRDARGEIVTL